ncbi:unnamed protein product [Cercospora beticola]|nr:unnamed protein product [Cercospora beticola]
MFQSQTSQIPRLPSSGHSQREHDLCIQSHRSISSFVAETQELEILIAMHSSYNGMALRPASQVPSGGIWSLLEGVSRIFMPWTSPGGSFDPRFDLLASRHE